MSHSLGLAVYRSQRLEGDEIILDGVAPRLRGVPVEDTEVCLKVGEPEVDRTGGENLVALQETTAQLGHVTQAVEVLEVDVRHIAGAELLAEWRQSNPSTTPAVVSPVRQAAEHLAVPGGADHHVRQLDRGHTVGVAELVQTPAVATSSVRQSLQNKLK